MENCQSAVSRREFPRIPCELKIGYELVKWNDAPSGTLKKPRFTRSVNISATGLGLAETPELDRGAINRLISGKEKIRLAIYLDENGDPVLTFARLVWSRSDGTDGIPDKGASCGFNFIDVSPEAYRRLTGFVASLETVSAAAKAD